ncbi:hypothetical protein Anacy_5757 (plasmid) [Anabaena cylindrica PCC 7122]|uniref:ATP-dependent RecD2 DNA helicase OB-fold domain-containing protein n=1 Tax=Anabaena cylindrica (strain ATCC 27899 / PCC 7122) TaxID=272123 RepID=K9ZP95_ANACC|nr:hypothetical protein Anacy_5757 [Anabaena cylindrica PCC 7122]BAY06509.1 RecD/TraA family helicase [Anabaena cylindrica PCC 7122]
MSTAPNPTDQQINASIPQETITGVVERLTFYSGESGYTVARLTRSSIKDLTTIVGSFANIQPGQTLQLTGFWREHPQYGSQFQVINYKETKPATLTGIEKYLGSGLIKGVGPVTAKRIVAHFGTETLEIIENQIDRLIEERGWIEIGQSEHINSFVRAYDYGGTVYESKGSYRTIELALQELDKHIKAYFEDLGI